MDQRNLLKTTEHIVWEVDHIALEKARPAPVGWTISQNGVEETAFRRKHFRYRTLQNKAKPGTQIKCFQYKAKVKTYTVSYIFEDEIN